MIFAPNSKKSVKMGIYSWGQKRVLTHHSSLFKPTVPENLIKQAFY